MIDAKKVRACIFGHAIGDALGVPVEFRPRTELQKEPVTDMRGFGTYAVPAGAWSDDTSMTLCALESLARGPLDLRDIMANFGRWRYQNEFTPTGVVFDIGGTCERAIANCFIYDKTPEEWGLDGENANGNGALMRILPFVLWACARGEGREALISAVERGASLTHRHPRSTLGCILYAFAAAALLETPDKTRVTDVIRETRPWLEAQPEISHYRRIMDGTLFSLPEDEIRSSGYVVDTLEAALWCLWNTDSYEACVLRAVNLGSDTDTVAAVAGGLAGILYGYEAIPPKWLRGLLRADYVADLCDRAAAAWK